MRLAQAFGLSLDGVGSFDVDPSIGLAGANAVTQAIGIASGTEHAYRGHKQGKVRVEARCDGAEVRIRIADSGSWKAAPADGGNRGRGLMLIRAVSDWLALDCTPSGTTVDMIFRFPA